MIAYRYDSNGLYIGTVPCQLDPRTSKEAGEDIYLIPANSTTIEPLEPKEGYNVMWNGKTWEYVEIPVEPEPEPHIPTTEEKLAELDAQYNRDFAQLQMALDKARIYDNAELEAEIKADIIALDEQYDKDYEAIVGGAE